MAITAGMVKELREMTGAGMMDCKKALTETNGDMDAAVEVLRKSGAAKMEKKQSRIAAEGIARVAVNGNVAVVAEVNSETDFVAKNETFQEFVQTVADTALASGLNGGANGEDIDALLATNGLSELLVEKTVQSERSYLFVDLQRLQVMLLLLISMVVEESVLSLQQMVQQTMQLKKQSQILLCRLQL